MHEKDLKLFKEALKSELAPLLVGIRNDLSDLKDEGVPLQKGKDGKTPVKGKDYFDGKDGKTPKKGVDYNDGARGPRGFRGPEGKSGKTPIKGIDYNDGKDGEPGKTIIKEKTLSPQEIRNMLESLEGENKLSADAIQGLDDYLDRALSQVSIPSAIVGSGTPGVIAQTVTFLTETPQGLIDSSNKSYTVTSAISKIVNFAINGQFIHPSDYSFSGKSIVFGTALDASLSSTSFTITYIPI